MRSASVLCLLLATVVSLAGRQSPSHDIVIVNARIFTEAGQPFAASLGVRDDRVSFVGDAAAGKAAAATARRVIDAGGRLVIPGINDAHTHPSVMPAHTALDGPPAMTEDPAFEVVLGRVKDAVRKAPPSGWIIGDVGGRVLEDPKATRAAIDAVSEGHPVMLDAWHGHGTIFNTAALRALGVSDREPDPAGGRFGRMPDGTLSGLAEEYACYILRQRLTMMPGEAAQRSALEGFAREAASYGITTAQAMSTSYPAAHLAKLVKQGPLATRVRVIDFTMDLSRPWSGTPASGVKYVVDGTPVERLMYLREPYTDDPRNKGRLNLSPEKLRSLLPVLVSARQQIMFHATGDAAIDEVFNALESSRVSVGTAGNFRDGGAYDWRPDRPRLEHADMFGPEHFERAKKLGVVVVQNPSHFMIPDVLKARLGARAAGAQIVKTIIREGIPFALGSDGPLNPFLNIMFATMHPTNPAEALTVEEALVAYTHGSAFAERAETTKGRLRTGMLADLAILSQDIFKVPPPELPKTSSILTMVGGRVVHEAK